MPVSQQTGNQAAPTCLWTPIEMTNMFTTSGGIRMRKAIAVFCAISFACANAAFASKAETADKSDNKSQQRLQNSGQVIRDILNIPDDIPQDLLDKAECVIVIPSVIKVAFGLSGSYGRGAMTC